MIYKYIFYIGISNEKKRRNNYKSESVRQIALQAVDIDDFEGWEFLKKFRAKSSGDMKKLMGCVGH